jgi:hypothetical protein
MNIREGMTYGCYLSTRALNWTWVIPCPSLSCCHRRLWGTYNDALSPLCTVTLRELPRYPWSFETRNLDTCEAHFYALLVFRRIKFVLSQVLHHSIPVQPWFMSNATCTEFFYEKILRTHAVALEVHSLAWVFRRGSWINQPWQSTFLCNISVTQSIRKSSVTGDSCI